MTSYEGRNVVVTGGTGALGAAVVERLLRQGARIHVPAWSAQDAARFPLGSDARVEVLGDVDLSDEVQVDAYYAALPPLWASIHLAGGFAPGTLEDTSADTLRRMLSTNTISAFLCCKAAAARIRANGLDGGRIVNVGARPALVPSAGVAAYAASKGAVTTLTLALAEELKGAGIWVNAVIPSTMDTPANRAGMPDADFSTWPTTDEVAATIEFLASPGNTCTRGALVPVFGRT
jgi:NAD(P)-dependent dehydrogenase (short-subunit alcohol dehydrogenase family)